ncbi:16S rRNA (guanine(966)-N(2))-methyltransferase RsmD [Cohnella silvisoli]|uniref:16S rRNA (Guanine(966)-N(2))-methyltransferase RsmD n=1 Tax=Cohnella silvisoli TaxID=2873699 RepID=A0ABV1KWF1_9BACL|nr:16S rRNA (guanine(966)-N(2))-methyltransferase RsmD [Cohnella silvisoli]MCD9023298.1 16S rRNA (guanine(966)-N(2))-methyltransferase RsmD [Cohnella silvisoli]
MRVISGQAKGHPLKAVPGSNTRPTTDKVKESLFNIIGPYFDEERVLDLFAGTGGLGIEALSRGAASAVFVDSNAQSIEVIRHNLKSTRLADRAEVYRNDARRAIKVLQRAAEPFQIIFLDPPYAMKDCDELLMDMSSKGIVDDGAIAVVEHHPDVVYKEQFGDFNRTRYAVYGEIALSVYRHEIHTHKEEDTYDEPSSNPHGA